jgi:hypothetical protein
MAEQVPRRDVIPRKQPASKLDRGAPYANWFQIGFNASEFLLEFAQQDSAIHTRVYVSPQHARVLSELLLDAIRRHEVAFGTHVEPSRSKSKPS